MLLSYFVSEGPLEVECQLTYLTLSAFVLVGSMLVFVEPQLLALMEPTGGKVLNS